MSNLVESLKDEYENLEELQKGAVVLMSTYMMRGMKTAMRYVVEAKRTQVTSTDIHICVR